MGKIISEICVDTVESAIIAEKAGADEVELCQALNLGGLTPSIGLLKTIRENIDIPINIMVRPRSGDYCYSDYEKKMMLEDIGQFVEYGVDGIVLGALWEDGTVDLDFLEKCLEISGDIPITFHRAFDMVKDMEETLNDLIALKIERILTSGGQNSAYKGLRNIKKLVEFSEGRIEVMAGAGISKENVEEIINIGRVEHIHFSAGECQESKMIFRNKDISMSRLETIEEYNYFYTSEDEARAIIELVKNMG